MILQSLIKTMHWAQPVNSSKKKSVTRICSRCKKEIGKGLPHSTCTIASSSVNISSQVLELPSKQQEQVVSKLLSRKATHELGKGGFHKNVALKLATKGRSAFVTLNPKPSKAVYFSEESLANLQAYMGHSNLAMKKVSHWLSVHVGRKGLPPYIRSTLSHQGKTLEDFYKIQWMEFDISGGKVEKRPVFYGDAQDIVHKVCEEREIVGPCFIKLMADSGQGSFKISLSIMPEGYDPVDAEDTDCLKARTTYSEGGQVYKGKLSGVKRLIILVNVPDINESWSNLKKLWDLAGINKISYLLCADIKLSLTALGLQTATSMHPCPYCFVSLRQLRGTEPVEGDDVGSPDEHTTQCDLFNTTFKERTFGNRSDELTKFREMGGLKLKHARLCNSTVNDSILQEDDDIRVLEKVPFPELHIMEGILNHLFWSKGGLVDILGREKAMEWAIKCNVVSAGYHGEVFEGPASRKLLKNSNFLLSKEFLVGVRDPLSLIPLVTTLQAFNKLVEASIGCNLLKGNIAALLEKFTVAYMTTGLSVPLKVHVTMEHLIPSLANLGGRGFGLTSEQTGESVHHHFQSKFWARYKVSTLTNPNFENAWFSANLDLCSKQL